MSRLLIVYGTTDGQTAKIVRAIADIWRDKGSAVDVVLANQAGTLPTLADYDGIVVAASLHAGGYQRAVRHWVRRHAAALTGKTSVFLSVCLGVLQDDAKVRNDLDRIARDFFRETGWTPTMTKMVAGALLFTKYGWQKRRIMRHMARKAGMETDIRRDYEFTNWADLEVFAKGFLWTAKLCAPRPAQIAEAVI
jgi:menaquinone-dependent protoporphyrinogen oxidase